jgi:hypothetical protein
MEPRTSCLLAKANALLLSYSPTPAQLKLLSLKNKQEKKKYLRRMNRTQGSFGMSSRRMGLSEGED